MSDHLSRYCNKVTFPGICSRIRCSRDDALQHPGYSHSAAYRSDPDNSKWFLTMTFVQFKWNLRIKINTLIQILVENSN